jgi:hypothetical protein
MKQEGSCFRNISAPLDLGAEYGFRIREIFSIQLFGLRTAFDGDRFTLDMEVLEAFAPR